VLKIHGVKQISYTANDGRTKLLTAVKYPSYNNYTWEYGLYIQDEDNSKAFELFWNQKPIKGFAIFKPSKVDNNVLGLFHPNAMIKIEYSEEVTDYDKQMIVSISDLNLYQINDMSSLKMFVGKKGNHLDIFGNSNHPNAILIDPKHTGGRNWAFVAHSDDNLNIGVAKVALPECNLDNIATLFTDYSIEKVLHDEINTVYGSVVTPTQLDSIANVFLQNAKAPGYFIGIGGFVSCGTDIPANPGFTTDFINLDALSPYIPKDISTLSIPFAK
jgi:hypothetical protein